MALMFLMGQNKAFSFEKDERKQLQELQKGGGKTQEREWFNIVRGKAEEKRSLLYFSESPGVRMSWMTAQSCVSLFHPEQPVWCAQSNIENSRGINSIKENLNHTLALYHPHVCVCACVSVSVCSKLTCVILAKNVSGYLLYLIISSIFIHHIFPANHDSLTPNLLSLTPKYKCKQQRADFSVCLSLFGLEKHFKCRIRRIKILGARPSGI